MRELTLREKMNKRTLVQSVVLGLAGGPLVWLLLGPHTASQLCWSIVAMAVAPPLVDALRPTYVR